MILKRGTDYMIYCYPITELLGERGMEEMHCFFFDNGNNPSTELYYYGYGVSFVACYASVLVSIFIFFLRLPPPLFVLFF